MHLDKTLTTTSFRKKSIKITKAQQAELEKGWRERNVRLREINLPKETFEQYMEWVYGKGKKTTETNKGGRSSKTSPEVYKRTLEPKEMAMAVQPAGRPWKTLQGACSSKQAPTYTGTKIIGIGVLHKSCLQPIFSEEQAKDISSMRR